MDSGDPSYSPSPLAFLLQNKTHNVWMFALAKYHQRSINAPHKCTFFALLNNIIHLIEFPKSLFLPIMGPKERACWRHRSCVDLFRRGDGNGGRHRGVHPTLIFRLRTSLGGSAPLPRFLSFFSAYFRFLKKALFIAYVR